MNAGPPRLLVIDDEAPILFAMKEYFETFGYSVHCAREREEAEALLAKVGYDVVIADLRLTGIDGTEGLGIVSYVRARYPKTKVILLTGYAAPAIEEEARRLGVDYFLRKPKPLPDLAQIVMSLVRKS